MQRALWVTDIHLKFSNLNITKELFDKIINTVETEKADSVIITGDVNDSKSIIRSECLTQIRDFLRYLKVPVYILVGNHDLHNTRQPELGHCLESLSDFKHVTIVDKPIVVGNIKMIPYIDDKKLLRKELKKDNVQYLFCHNGINGAQMNTKGTVDDFSLLQSNFDGFKKVFVGHYHNYSDLGNIVYLGSPFSHSFNEANVEKFIGIIDFSNNDLKLIPTNLRQHLDYHFHTTDRKDIKKQINYKQGDLLRITLEGTKESNTEILGQLEGIDAKIILKNTDRIRKRINIDPNASRNEILNKYLEKINTDLDKDKIRQIGSEILNA